MSTLALISGAIAALCWMLTGYWWDEDRQDARCHGATNAPATQPGVRYGYGSFTETEAYAMSAGYRALTRSTT